LETWAREQKNFKEKSKEVKMDILLKLNMVKKFGSKPSRYHKNTNYYLNKK